MCLEGFHRLTQASGVPALGSGSPLLLFVHYAINYDTRTIPNPLNSPDKKTVSLSGAIAFPSILSLMFKFYKISDRVNIKSRFYRFIFKTTVSYKIEILGKQETTFIVK